MHPDNIPESDPSTLPPPVPSFGQKAVGYSFNPGGSNEVSKFKEIMAIAIDEMNDLRNTTKSQEVKRLCSVTITELQGAQMWGVKAITWQD
ncbi:hypothetical protein KBD33_06065 [Candidatus Gracilibacteria bacterium]|nr:hypothetical protein [Candidatus Gracilibacteria bacterium]